LRKALDVHPDDLIQLIKDSGLRGPWRRGLSTGLSGASSARRWKAHYLVVNADEASRAPARPAADELGPACTGRGHHHPSYGDPVQPGVHLHRGERCTRPAGSQRGRRGVREGLSRHEHPGFRFDWTWSCTAARAPHLRRGTRCSLVEDSAATQAAPAVPAIAGLYASPTVVNNVGTIASVPYIGLAADWWKSMGTEKSSGR